MFFLIIFGCLLLIYISHKNYKAEISEIEDSPFPEKEKKYYFPEDF